MASPNEATRVDASEEPQSSPAVALDLPSNLANAIIEDGKANEERSPVGSGSQPSPEPKEFREGGYGWVVVVAVLLVNAHTWGLNSSYAVFLAYYLRSGAFPGASPLAFAFVGGLSVSIALLISPLVTVCIRVLGTRTSLWIGIVLESVAFIGASFSSQIWHLLLSQGVAFGVGMGFCFNATVGVVPQWFTMRRSFANAVAAGGSGLGGLTYSLATNAMISSIGLAWAFRVLAIIAFVVNGLCALVIRDRNKAVGAVHVAFHMGLWKRLEFLLFLTWAFFALLAYIIVVFSLPDYAQAVGFTATQGSVVAACFNLSQGLGRPFIGLISDRVGRINVAGLSTLVAALSSFFLWIFAGKHYAGIVIYSLFGAFAGSLWATAAPVAAEVVGLQLLPSALSITWLVLVLPATFAEAIALALRKGGVNGYIGVQVFTATMYIVSFLSMWVLRVWKLRDIEAQKLTEEEKEAGGVRGPGAIVSGEQLDSDGQAAEYVTPTPGLSIFKSLWVIQRV